MKIWKNAVHNIEVLMDTIMCGLSNHHSIQEASEFIALIKSKISFKLVKNHNLKLFRNILRHLIFSKI